MIAIPVARTLFLLPALTLLAPILLIALLLALSLIPAWLAGDLNREKQLSERKRLINSQDDYLQRESQWYGLL